MEFAYHWKDRTGTEHFTDKYNEADKALHDGCLIFLVSIDKQHKNGSDRHAM